MFSSSFFCLLLSNIIFHLRVGQKFTHKMDTNRVSKELREIASDGASGVSVELVGDSLAHMRGTITGAAAALRVYDDFIIKSDDDVHIQIRFFLRV